MSDIKGCLFDLDGVIVDTAKFHFLGWQRLAQSLGFNFSENDNERLKGVSRMDSLDILLSIGNLNVNDDEKLTLAAKKNQWYLEYISSMTPADILPGVLECLNLLNENNIKLAIGSSSKNAKTILTQVGLTEKFDAIIDGTDLDRAKPDPQVFLLGAQKLGLLPDECAVFEDAFSGIQAAKGAKMLAIGIGEKSALPNADIVLKNLNSFNLSILK